MMTTTMTMKTPGHPTGRPSSTTPPSLVWIASLLMATAFTGCRLIHGPAFDPRTETTPPAADDAAFTAAPATGTIRPEWLQPPVKTYTLGPGDKLDIEVLGEEGTRAATFVTPDGKIYYSLLPGITAQGRTLGELQKDLEAGLTTLYRRPRVSVSLTEANSQRIWVLGRLYAPGIYPLKRPMRILDAISLAGGLFAARMTGTTEELADLRHSFIKRKGQHLPVNFEKLIRDGDLSHNIYLEPDDYIYLPSSLSSEVYVFGAVTEPRPVGFMNEMNIMSAIAHVAGALPDADLEHVTIVRGSLVEPKYAVVNVRDIAAGKATNFRLQPGDIVYVPKPGMISLEHYAKVATETFVQVVGANEGANAVGTGINANIGITPDGKVTPVVPAGGAQ